MRYEDRVLGGPTYTARPGELLDLLLDREGPAQEVDVEQDHFP